MPGVIWRLDIEYDGTPFRGWARQDGEPTVQDEVERALAIALRTDAVETIVAGRTDAGVHAIGQVASFRFDGEMPDTILRSLNGLTSPAVAIRSVSVAPEGFDARRSARSRTYCYRVLLRRPDSPFAHGRAWWISREIDRGLLDRCAEAIVGEHDFTAFTPTDTYHTRFRRRIDSARWIPEQPMTDPGRGPDRPTGTAPGDFLQFWVTGDSFMRSMVRILIGTMIDVADGSRSIEDFQRLLDGATRPEAGMTAPAQGLFLVSVAY
jgi:tRNA pseudouridine38-40 synthase